MATAAQKLDQLQCDERCVIKHGKTEFRGSILLNKLVHDAGLLTEEKRKLEAEIKQLSADILADAQEYLQECGTLHICTADGVYQTTITLRETVELADVDGLIKTVGIQRFEMLVNTTTTHKPTAELKTQALDADNPEAEALRKHLVTVPGKPTVSHKRPAQPKED